MAPVIDLRSDTVTTPTPAMRRAMAEAEVGDDLYGEDPTTARLEEAVAARFGHEAALFVPTGTMGNQICARLAAPPGTELIACEDNHLLLYEEAGVSRLAGIQLHTLEGDRGVLDPDAVAARIRTAEYGVPTSAIAVEQTHNRGGGTVWPFDTLTALRRLTAAAGLHLHCDGARIWNASVAAGVALDAYGALFDSLSVCFSKGLSAPVGSAVIGSRALVAEARTLRQLYGGGMRQSGVLTAAALVGLESMVARLADDHAHARRLAEHVAERIPDCIDLGTVETNILLLSTDPLGTDAPDFCRRLADHGVLAGTMAPNVVRLVFHCGIDAAATDRAAEAVVQAAGPGAVAPAPREPGDARRRATPGPVPPARR